MDRDPARHLTDRTEAEHQHGAPLGTSAYSTDCQAVGSTSERNRNRSSGGPSGTVIGMYCASGHPEVLRLPARHLAVQLAEAEQRRPGPLLAHLRYDLDYLRNWSLRLDLLIIMRTVVMVFRDRRAY